MEGKVIVDNLPYIDMEYDDEPGIFGDSELVFAKLKEEYRRYCPKNSLETISPLILLNAFESPFESRQKRRYELQPPPCDKIKEGHVFDLLSMLDYCSPAWQRYLQALQDGEIDLKKFVELKQHLPENNWQRKLLQMREKVLEGVEEKRVSLDRKYPTFKNKT